MPEQPEPRRQPKLHEARSPEGDASAEPSVAKHRRYAELHCRSNYSFLEGASHPDELVNRAHELGYSALAIADRNTLAGVVRAHEAARETDLKLLIGAEVIASNCSPLVLLATDQDAYSRLSTLLTVGRRNAPKGECHLSQRDIEDHADGLLAVSSARFVSMRHGKPSPKSVAANWLKDVFKDRCWMLAELHLGSHDATLLKNWQQLSAQAGIPLAAANDVHYHVRERQRLHDVLTAIRHTTTVDLLGNRRFSNGERFLRPIKELEALFAAAPELLDRTAEIADRCSFCMSQLKYEYPVELVPEGMTSSQHLANLTWAGAQDRYPNGVPEKVRSLIEHELKLIRELKYEGYFLTVWDLVKFARERDILCQGRGSAANSAVCFCLKVTSVDPDKIDVLFERFVSKERDEAPDIDVDFEHERREEVLQYIYEKYGRDRAAMTAEVITYRHRSAVREVGKALGLSLDRVDVLSKTLEHYKDDSGLETRLREAGLNPDSPVSKQLVSIVHELVGFPRHLSQHVGGMVITQRPISEIVPIENAAMADRTVIQWDKNDLETLGILKVDCLSLGMLTAIRKCFHMIEKHTGRELTLATVPAEDPLVYAMASRADTIGVFQIESRAQMSMLPRLKPQCYYDLVIEVAIVRPGPIQGDMVHPYLRRRNGDEPVEFPDDRIRAVLEKTLGVPIFQEQAMRLAIVAAGFTPGEADQLRRAMGAWRKRGIMDQFREKLIEGMLANGYEREFGERLFRQLQGFGEYGFPESHAASFALLVYVSLWLKKHYPGAFTASLLNSQPMGFYAPAQLVRDSKEHGVAILPIDVNRSDWDCLLEPVSNTGTFTQQFALRLGFRLISGLSESHIQQLVAERESSPFSSLDEFTRRTGFSNALLTRLSKADAFNSIAHGRRSAMWQSMPAQEKSPLLDNVVTDATPKSLPDMSPQREVSADYESHGLTLRAHPMTYLRDEVRQLKGVSAVELRELRAGRHIKVAGLVLLRQRPSTANGITFVTLEDESGFTNLVIRPDIWERHHRVARTASALLVHGTLQKENDVIHVMVEWMDDLSEKVDDLRSRSRDFR
jgi:error-prone DNA polymerase